MEKEPLKLSLVVMVRNEIDIIRLFLKHVDSLFDQVYIIDHRSIDGTTELIKQAVEQRPEWEYYFLNHSAKVQQEVTNIIRKKAFLDGADFVLVLDADEFIYVQDRFSLENRLKSLRDLDKVAYFTWINCIPEDISLSEISDQTSLFLPSEEAIFNKVVVPRSCFIQDNGIFTSKGSHKAYWSDGSEIPGVKIGNIIHIPIRSREQAIRKAIISRISHLMVFDEAIFNNTSSYQYNFFLDQITKGNLTISELKHFTYIYDTPDYMFVSNDEVDAYWKNAIKTSLEQLSIAINFDFDVNIDVKSVDNYILIADALKTIHHLYPQSVEIRLDDDKLVVTGLEAEEKIFNWMNQNELEGFEQREIQLIEERNKLSEEIGMLRQKELFYSNSKSWRITKPLRNFMTILRGNKTTKNCLLILLLCLIF
jgi:hypothetical protein